MCAARPGSAGGASAPSGHTSSVGPLGRDPYTLTVGGRSGDMDRQGFVRLALLAVGLAVASFVVLGSSRLVVPYRTAQLLAAPVGLVAFSLLVYLFVRATLSAAGVWAVAESEEG